MLQYRQVVQVDISLHAIRSESNKRVFREYAIGYVSKSYILKRCVLHTRTTLRHPLRHNPMSRTTIIDETFHPPTLCNLITGVV